MRQIPLQPKAQQQGLAPVTGRQGPATAGPAVFQSAAEWQAAWTAAGQGGPAPKADFNSEMVVMISLGEKSTGGYKIETQVMTDPTDSTRLIVLYKEISPKGDSFAIQMRTRPWIARKVKKHAVVAFELNQRLRALGTVFTAENNEKMEKTLGKIKDFNGSAFAEAERR